MKHEKLSDKWFYWKLHKRVRFKYWLDHQKLKLRIITIGWEERYEFEEYEGYTPFQFLKSLYLAVLFNKICWNCSGRGMTGYYEPETCNICEGLRFNWTGEVEPNWEEMGKLQ